MGAARNTAILAVLPGGNIGGTVATPAVVAIPQVEAAVQTLVTTLAGSVPVVVYMTSKPIDFSSSQVHHIATNKGAWGQKFKDLFDEVGIDLDDALNKMDLPGHSGRHTNRYHEFVFDRLKSAITGKTGQQAKDAFIAKLAELRGMLEANPRLPYTDGGL